MTAGLQITQAEINNQAGSLARSVFSVMQNLAEFKAWLDTVGSAGLQNNYQFSSDDAATLVSAINDLARLGDIFRGTATQTPAYDFRVFAQRLIGTGLF